jgi:hypothetical protein
VPSSPPFCEVIMYSIWSPLPGPIPPDSRSAMVEPRFFGVKDVYGTKSFRCQKSDTRLYCLQALSQIPATEREKQLAKAHELVAADPAIVNPIALG